VNQAGEQLTDWADAWRPYLPAMPTDPQQIARLADRADDRPRLGTAFDSYARHHAEHAHPEHAQLRKAAESARAAHGKVWRAVAAARRQHENELAPFGSLAWTPDPTERLSDADRDIATAHTELAAVRARITRLTAEPALLTQPADRPVYERDNWRARQDADPTPYRSAAPLLTAPEPGVRLPRPEDLTALTRRTAAGPGIGR
jgi:exodeoxyribonuclease V alpha subunit